MEVMNKQNVILKETVTSSYIIICCLHGGYEQTECDLKRERPGDTSAVVQIRK